MTSNLVFDKALHSLNSLKLILKINQPTLLSNPVIFEENLKKPCACELWTKRQKNLILRNWDLLFRMELNRKSDMSVN